MKNKHRRRAVEVMVWGEGKKGLWSFENTIDIPEAYVEIPPGDPYLTRKIKELAEVVYVRMVKRKELGLSVRVGLLAPEPVVREALFEAERTRDERERKNARSQVYRKQKEEKKQREMIRRIKGIYSDMPEGEGEIIVAHAFEVGSGRVGRTTTVSEEQKIELAVKAHIRHVHTEYDSLIAAGLDRETARDQVRDEVEGLHIKWLQGQEPEREES
jgi:hypothetical protein